MTTMSPERIGGARGLDAGRRAGRGGRRDGEDQADQVGRPVGHVDEHRRAGRRNHADHGAIPANAKAGDGTLEPDLQGLRYEPGRARRVLAGGTTVGVDVEGNRQLWNVAYARADDRVLQRRLGAARAGIAKTAKTAATTESLVKRIGHSFRPSPVPYALRGLHPRRRESRAPRHSLPLCYPGRFLPSRGHEADAVALVLEDRTEVPPAAVLALRPSRSEALERRGPSAHPSQPSPSGPDS